MERTAASAFEQAAGRAQECTAQQLADRFGLPRGWVGRGQLAISEKHNITLEQFTLWLADKIRNTVCGDLLVGFVKVWV